MGSLKYQFMEAVLGQEGSRALKKAADRSKVLENALVPRAVLAWLDVITRVDYEGEIPGIDNSYLQFVKSESGFQGSITIDELIYSFENASKMHLAASISVALGASDELDPALKDLDIARLGKSIDLLAKAQILAKHGLMEETVPEKEESVQTEELEKKQPKLLKVQEKVKTSKVIKTYNFKPLKLMKSDIETVCVACGGNQIKNGKLTGCMCIRSLMDKLLIKSIDNGFIIQSKILDEEESELLIGVLRCQNIDG